MPEQRTLEEELQALLQKQGTTDLSPGEAERLQELRQSHEAQGPQQEAQAAGAQGAADPSGYVWDPRGYYWHPVAQHWYEPYAQVYYSVDGQVIPAEEAQAALAAALGGAPQPTDVQPTDVQVAAAVQEDAFAAVEPIELPGVTPQEDEGDLGGDAFGGGGIDWGDFQDSPTLVGDTEYELEAIHRSADPPSTEEAPVAESFFSFGDVEVEANHEASLSFAEPELAANHEASLSFAEPELAANHEASLSFAEPELAANHEAPLSFAEPEPITAQEAQGSQAVPTPERTLLEDIPLRLGGVSDPNLDDLPIQEEPLPPLAADERDQLFGSPDSFFIDEEEPQDEAPAMPVAMPVAMAAAPAPAAAPPAMPVATATAPAVAAVRTKERAIVHLMDGQVKRGLLHPGDLFEELRLETSAGMESLPHQDVQIVFFLREPTQPPGPQEGTMTNVFLPRGRSLTGYAPSDASQEEGFFLTPRGEGTTSRVFLYPWAILRMTPLG